MPECPLARWSYRLQCVAGRAGRGPSISWSLWTAARDPLLCTPTFAHFESRFYRAMLCIRGTSHGPVSVRVCLSVCPSVCHKSEFY